MGTFLAWLSRSWLGRQIQKYLIKEAWAVAEELGYYLWTKFKKWRRGEQQEGTVKKVEEVFNDSKATPEDKGKAYEEFTNRGR